MRHAVETEGLSRDFGDIHAVDGLSLRVPEGSVFGFLGPNGAGKTTTLHLLLGLLPPSSGWARVAGIDVAADASGVRRRCGALLEFPGLYERLSAWENLEFHARLHGMPRASGRARARELLEAIGLWDRRAERVGTWSRGMKQQLAIARTIMHGPEIAFLDEPTAGFDPVAAVRLRGDVRRLAKEQGVTVFLTTHNMREAEAVCDTVGVLRQGRLVAAGTPDSLAAGDAASALTVTGAGFSGPVLAALAKRRDVLAAEATAGGVRIRLRPGKPAHPVVRFLVDSGVRVEEVRRERASLEESFLRILGEAA